MPISYPANGHEVRASSVDEAIAVMGVVFSEADVRRSLEKFGYCCSGRDGLGHFVNEDLGLPDSHLPLQYVRWKRECEGMDAYQAGADVDANPHTDNSEAARFWDAGWVRAQHADRPVLA